MKHLKKPYGLPLLLIFTLILIACGAPATKPSPTSPPATNTPIPTNITVPTDTPTVEPTATPIPADMPTPNPVYEALTGSYEARIGGTGWRLTLTRRGELTYEGIARGSAAFEGTFTATDAEFTTGLDPLNGDLWSCRQFPLGVYIYTLTDTTLTLRVKDDQCQNRASVFARTWTKTR